MLRVSFSLLALGLTPLLACGEASIYSGSHETPAHTVRMVPSENGWDISLYDENETEYKIETQYKGELPMETSCPDDVASSLRLPANQTVDFLVTSHDTIGELCISELGIKLSAVPGMLSHASVETGAPKRICGSCPTQSGDYDIRTTLVIDIVD